MDGQGLQMLKPPAFVIHRHPAWPAIISESLIHFASVQDLTKSITVSPICVCPDVEGKERKNITHTGRTS